MKLKFLSVVAASAILFGCAEKTTETKGYSHVETHEKAEGEVTIPYTKYELDNGLTVVVHEDHSDPIVYVDVTYHVGSAREEIGRSGFAHFFEHMMFQGSDHVADEEHFKTVNEAGGTLNGTTNSDRTNYFETLPANQLEIALWLEADRMGWLLDAVTQEKFEVQRSTVKNERGQRYENRPYGLVNETVIQALYPHGHPYSWSTIGYLEELDAATLKDLKDFFLRWYGPNNATLTVAGDVSKEEVMELAVKYFGPINRGPEVEDMPAMVPTLEEDRYVSYEDKIRFPLLQLNFPTVEARHPDEAPLDVLSDIMGGNKSSLFYQEFVKTQKAIQASVGHPCSELSGNLSFTVVAYPGTNLADLEKSTREVMAKFEEKGVSDEDLERFKASYESNTIQRLASVQGKGAMLASAETFTGSPNLIEKDLKRYMEVTKEDVLRVYDKYVKGKHAVILSYVPVGQGDLVAAEDNFTPVIGRTPETVLNNYDTLVYNKPVDEGWDRSVKPEPGPAPFVQVPEYWEDEMDNGIKAIGTFNDEIPMVTVQVTLPAGSRNESLDQAGISGLLTSMMSEDTENYTAEAMAEELEKLGSRISIYAGSEDITVSITSLEKNLDQTLALAEEMMFKPAFTEEDFDRIKKQTLEGIANRVNDASSLANASFGKLLYGEGHIKAVPSEGTTETVTAITLEDVKAYYNNYFSPSGARLVVVGATKKDEIMPKLDFIASWEGPEYTWPEQPAAKTAEAGTIYFMDKPGAAQSEIRIGYLSGLTYEPLGESYKAGIMNYALGGNFNSRINLNLREDKGFTYGARSGFRSQTKEPGLYVASAGVRKMSTDSAVREFMYEIETYAESGITPEELDYTKKAITLSEARDYETLRQKAGFLRRILDYDLDSDYVKKQSEILQNMTVADINAIADKHLRPSDCIIVVVGDKEVCMEGIKSLGYKVVEIDTDGNEI